MAWSPADNREPERFACASNAALERSGFPCRVARGPGGLAMYAARPITAGEVLLHERPLALTVCRGARSYRCALCLSDSRAGTHTACSTRALWRRAAPAAAPRDLPIPGLFTGP
eukprot:scaffold2878_cov111-Isochrysis_galbana.AAC.5